MQSTLVEKVFTYIRRYIALHSYPPLREEIARDCMLLPRDVALALDILEAQGRIQGSRPREAIRVLELA